MSQEKFLSISSIPSPASYVVSSQKLNRVDWKMFFYTPLHTFVGQQQVNFCVLKKILGHGLWRGKVLQASLKHC